MTASRLSESQRRVLGGKRQAAPRSAINRSGIAGTSTTRSDRRLSPHSEGPGGLPARPVFYVEAHFGPEVADRGVTEQSDLFEVYLWIAEDSNVNAARWVVALEYESPASQSWMPDTRTP